MIAPQHSTARRKRRVRCLLLLVTVLAGLGWRLLPLGLPPFAFKYGGSVLWAMAVYWSLAVLAARGRPVVVAGMAACVATAVEFLKQFYWAPLDRFRETLAGKLLLGRYFSWGALLAYAVGIALATVFDMWLFGPSAP